VTETEKGLDAVSVLVDAVAGVVATRPGGFLYFAGGER